MTLLESLILFLPAGIANTAPVLANKIPGLRFWKTPLDFGKSYSGKRIFGANKTWRGTVIGTAAGGLTSLLIHLINPQLIEHVRIAPFMPGVEMVVIGATLGFGALYGDAVGSFFKRQFNIPAGQSWFPFDQIDYIIGAIMATLPFSLFSLIDMAVILVVYFVLHLLVAYLAYKLKLKKQPI